LLAETSAVQFNKKKRLPSETLLKLSRVEAGKGRGYAVEEREGSARLFLRINKQSFGRRKRAKKSSEEGARGGEPPSFASRHKKVPGQSKRTKDAYEGTS